ncbi:hypothetical protein ACJMK2_037701 [Sinanodonta woodiana]|uniref:Uncharacterized protein n=1 Tax=Sinanodonta woodiana TaxID=1069815 RepID=A0ABD3WL88_SINWO
MTDLRYSIEGIGQEHSEAIQTSGVRVVKVLKEDARRMPTFFYVMHFRIKSWYKECERDTKCPKCIVVVLRPWSCKSATRASRNPLRIPNPNYMQMH